VRIEIDGAAIRSERDLHAFLSQALDFGSSYGANLSALWDRLSTDVERPVQIVWRDSELSRSALGDFGS
jgi:ribonuclease inhibitor